MTTFTVVKLFELLIVIHKFAVVIITLISEVFGILRCKITVTNLNNISVKNVDGSLE